MRRVALRLILSVWFAFRVGLLGPLRADEASSVTPAEASAIAREAYIYGSALVEGYRGVSDLHSDSTTSLFRVSLNQMFQVARIAGPDDTAHKTMNIDTLSGSAFVDLRAEPFIVAIPEIKGRYFSVQLVDLYTHNLDYIGLRKDGNGAGNYLLVGPDWKGQAPPNIRRVIPVETEFVTIIWRTQLFNPADLEHVMKVQAGYSLMPLHEYIAQTAPPEAPAVQFPRISHATMRSKFFDYLNFVLRFCPTHPTEKELRTRFAQIGIGPGRTFPPKDMSDELREAIEAGMHDGEQTIDEAVAKAPGAGKLFGSRSDLKNNYLNRAVGARIDLFGNTPAEAMSVDYQVDAEGQPLDTSKHDYILKVGKDNPPPVNGFWSVTMYDGKTHFMVRNHLKRQLINSPMLSSMQRDPDGGFTIYVQRDSPGEERETNWLPAPDGPMFAVLRLYLPKPAVLSGAWTSPSIEKMPRNAR